MNSVTLDRLRYQLAMVRRAPEWHIVRQVCTAAASDKATDWKELEKLLKDEVGFLVDQEIAAAKERAKAI